MLETRRQHRLNCQLFVKDDSGKDIDDPDPSGTNDGLFIRSAAKVEIKEVDLSGHLYVDLCQQESLILNGIPINHKFWQTSDRFRMLAKDGTESYRFQNTDAALKVALVKVYPDVILGQADVIKKHEALYPYRRSVIKTYAVPKGQFSFITDDRFQGDVPQQLIVGLVLFEAVHGSYQKNPYNFRHFNCIYAVFFVDGQSTPSEPLQMNYKSDQFIDAYHALYWNDEERAMYDTKEDFKGGYCLYVFRLSGDTKHRPEDRAHTRLEL